MIILTAETANWLFRSHAIGSILQRTPARKSSDGMDKKTFNDRVSECAESAVLGSNSAYLTVALKGLAWLTVQYCTNY